MRSRLQALGFIIAVVAVVGGVTFMQNWTPRQSPDTAEEAVAPGQATQEERDTRLTIPQPVTEGLPEYELHGHGHHDFWFQNDNTDEVDVGLRSKSCKCSKVEALVLTAEEDKAFQQGMPRAVVAEALQGVNGLLPILSVAAAATDVAGPLGRPNRWTALTPGDEKGVRVPAGATGFIRLNWDGRAKGPLRLGVKVWAQVHEQPSTRGIDTSLEVPINIVDPLRVAPQTVTVNYLEPGRTSTVDAYCWSSTRVGFTIQAAEKSNDPCFRCACEALTGEEFRTQAQQLRLDPLLSQTNPLAIYRVRVTVSERLPDGRQLDLGPFLRDIYVTPDAPDLEPVVLSVAGTVRGDIDVGAGEERDRILLRSFPANRGTSEIFPVVCRQPGTRLKLDTVTPRFVQVELRERTGPDEAGHYDLSVTIPPNQAEGKLPEDSSVYLQATAPGQSPRRVRIPILGTATLALDSR